MFDSLRANSNLIDAHGGDVTVKNSRFVDCVLDRVLASELIDVWDVWRVTLVDTTFARNMGCAFRLFGLDTDVIVQRCTFVRQNDTPGFALGGSAIRVGRARSVQILDSNFDSNVAQT